MSKISQVELRAEVLRALRALESRKLDEPILSQSEVDRMQAAFNGRTSPSERRAIMKWLRSIR